MRLGNWSVIVILGLIVIVSLLSKSSNSILSVERKLHILRPREIWDDTDVQEDESGYKAE